MMTDWDWNYEIAEAMEEPNMTIPWEAGKEYTLKNGMRVKIDAINRGGHYPIHGAFFSLKHNCWLPTSFQAHGSNKDLGSDYDLVPPAAPRIKGECWLVVTSSGVMGAFESKSAAVNWAAGYFRAAIIHVPYDVAEGDWL